MKIKEANLFGPSRWLFYSAMLIVIHCLADVAHGKNSLSIVPEEYRRAIGKSAVFSCKGNVENPELLSDMKWYWPDGREIEAPYDRIETIYDNSGSLNILFNSLQEEDLGTYRCEAVYAKNQKLQTNFTLKPYVPITFEDAPEDQYATMGTDYKVKCRVKADPVPQVDWKKDHKPIETSDHYILDKDGLLIRGVTEHDEGVYTCRVKVLTLGNVEDRIIKLEVQNAPKITSEYIRMEGNEHESVQFSCEATGKPKPLYEWVSENGQPLAEVERFTVDKYTGMLRIDGLRKEDTGTYTCTAKNNAGYDTYKAFLQVITKPRIEEFKNVTSHVGGETKLVCRASGQPLPDITFHKDSLREPFTVGSQKDRRIFIEQRKLDDWNTEASLSITDLLRTDDGLYACIAHNSRLTTELMGHITVEFPPTFINTPMQEAWSWNSNPVNVTCLAEAIPNATITWFKMGTPEIQIDEWYSEFVKQVGYESRSTLMIVPVSDDLYGFYKCVATNKHGRAEHKVNLRKARIPNIINQAKIAEKTATTIQFKISGPVDDGGLPITAFVVQYKESGYGHQWDRFKTKSWPIDQDIFIVEDLEPLRTYHFRFAAENLVGLGEWGREMVEVMPRRAEPEPPIIHVETTHGIAFSPYPHQFELRWIVPPDNGEQIEAFEITYYKVVQEEENKWESYGGTMIQEKPFGEPRHMLQGLEASQYYRVELRARNSIGNSLPAELIVKTSSDYTLSEGSTSSYSILKGGLTEENLPTIIIVSLIVLVTIVVLCDLVCYRCNQCGIIWAVTRSCSDKSNQNRKGDKKPVTSVIRNREAQDASEPFIHDTVTKTNGNGLDHGSGPDSQV